MGVRFPLGVSYYIEANPLIVDWLFIFLTKNKKVGIIDYTDAFISAKHENMIFCKY